MWTVEILATGFEMFLLVSYLNATLNKKYEKRYLYGLLALLMFLFTTFLDYLKMFANNKLPVLLCLWAVGTLILYKDKIYKKIFAVLSMFAILIVADYITFFIDTAISDFFVTKEYARTLMLFVSKTILFILVKIISVRKLKHYNNVKISLFYIVLILIVPFSTIVYFLETYYVLNTYQIESNTLILTSLLMLFLNLFITYLFESLLKTVETKNQADVLNKQYKMQIENYKYIEEKQKVINSIKHDINNHLIVISSLCNKKKYDELEDYLKGIYEKNNKGIIYARTGNSVIDFIVNEKCEQAASKGIEIKIHTDIKKKLTLPGDDLCIILGNIFDNAIEAAQDTDNGYIKINISTYNSILNIMFENNYSGERDVSNLTSAKDKNGFHGIGIANIKKIAEKHSGIFEMTAKDNVFKTNLHLPIIIEDC